MCGIMQLLWRCEGRSFFELPTASELRNRLPHGCIRVPGHADGPAGEFADSLRLTVL